MCEINKVSIKEQFLDRLDRINPNRSYSVIGDYKRSTEKILVEDKYGYGLITPKILLKGFNPSINSSVEPTKYCKNKFVEVHGDKYDYSKVIYKGAKNKVLIGCKLHGYFEQISSDHMMGRGCPKCGVSTRSKFRSLSKSNFLKKSFEVHKNKYSYNLIIDYRNYLTELPIVCSIHGTFNQSPKVHLRGGGCPKCGDLISGGFNRSSFIARAEGKKCIFYTIRCFNSNEEFYKIGITKYSVKKRYRTKTLMPYKYEIISEVKGGAGEIWDLEKHTKKLLKVFKYNPKITFAGKSECFTKIK